MLRFLLGVLVGAAATATWLQGPTARGSWRHASGRVDELSSAEHAVVADPAVNAGDGTPDQGSSRRPAPAVTP